MYAGTAQTVAASTTGKTRLQELTKRGESVR
jgi:hypothetical protein